MSSESTRSTPRDTVQQSTLRAELEKQKRQDDFRKSLETLKQETKAAADHIMAIFDGEITPDYGGFYLEWKGDPYLIQIHYGNWPQHVLTTRGEVFMEKGIFFHVRGVNDNFYCSKAAILDALTEILT